MAQNGANPYVCVAHDSQAILLVLFEPLHKLPRMGGVIKGHIVHPRLQQPFHKPRFLSRPRHDHYRVLGKEPLEIGRHVIALDA
eukprot:Transcript_8231.p5 GENE.Transcript_8231~~Transcript_8231.p5  ORF type:complete len:84 (-),score=5.86 Transcript_8231:2164-2415(-)